MLQNEKVNLQGVGEQLVHLGKLGGDAEVDCPVANLDDEAANDVGVDLGKGVRNPARRVACVYVFVAKKRVGFNVQCW